MRVLRAKGIAFKLIFSILASCSVIFIGIFGYNYLFSRRIIINRIHENAENLIFSAINKIETVLYSVEKVPDTIAYFLEYSSYTKEDLIELLQSIVEGNPEIYGSTISFEPNTFEKKSYYFAPYFYKNRGTENPETKLIYLGGKDYDYFNLPWYRLPKELDIPVWTEPYYDKGGGDILMSTYSAPFYGKAGEERKFMGVVTADVSLEWLEKFISSIKIARTGYAFIISKSGRIVTHPKRELITKETLFEIARQAKDKRLARIAADMVKGKSGYSPFTGADGKTDWLAYKPLPSTGWSLGIVFPQDELIEDIINLTHIVFILGALGFLFLLAVIILIARSITRPLRVLDNLTKDIAKGNLEFELSPFKSKDEVGRLADSFIYMKGALKKYIKELTETTAAKEKMESELKIAHDIQIGILPRALPKNDKFELYASLEPAREVGGDFYDYFFIDGKHLCVAIGDVSDKGVPAALFMSMAKTLIKITAQQSRQPDEILRRINRSIYEENSASMFVAIFLGILDTDSGEFTFVNAGHNPPVVLSAKEPPQFLEATPNSAVGLKEEAAFKKDKIILGHNDAIFMYTDGITEAFNARQEQFGEKRLEAELSLCQNKPVEVMAREVLNKVKSFSQGAPQSDDITVLALRYL